MALAAVVSETAIGARGCSFANLPWGVAPAAMWFKSRFYGHSKQPAATTTINLINCLVDELADAGIDAKAIAADYVAALATDTRIGIHAQSLMPKWVRAAFRHTTDTDILRILSTHARQTDDLEAQRWYCNQVPFIDPRTAATAFKSIRLCYALPDPNIYSSEPATRQRAAERSLRAISAAAVIPSHIARLAYSAAPRHYRDRLCDLAATSTAVPAATLALAHHIRAWPGDFILFTRDFIPIPIL